MLTASTALQNTIKQALAVTASPRVIAEWNHNRYIPITTVDNWGHDENTYGFDLDSFPISSITNPVRPTAGILIGKTGEGVSTSGWSDQPGAYRTYTSSPTSKYKYWTSQGKSGTTANGGGGFTIASNLASPYIVYGSSPWTNKIYICFETSWSTPVVYNVDTTTDGATWTTVATNIVPSSKGVVALYRQTDGSWSSTVNRTSPVQLKGIRVVVSSMSKQNAFLNLIEMGLRLEDDLTPFLIDYSVDMETDQSDFINPIGTANSNTGTVNLSNLDGRFNNTPPAVDTTPMYRGLIDRNASITIDLGIDTSAFGGTGLEYLRQATMVSDSWDGNDETSTIALKDPSKFLQEVNPNAMLMTNITIGQAIWRLLDSVGFNSYTYTRGASETASMIPYFWTDPKKTVWETIQDICLATQTAVYFDANGVLQIKTREATFDKTKLNAAGQWVFDYALNGSKQPDIVDLTPETNYEANHVTVHYKPTALAVDAQNRPISEVLWQPDSDVVLRSGALKADMTAGQMNFIISTQDATTWPFDGMVNIRGELIRFKGKEYRYVNKSNAWTYTTVNTNDDKLHVDNDLSSPTLGYQNYFTGKIFIVERGWDWTTPAAHDTTIASWTSASPSFGPATGAQTTWTGGLKHIPDQSIMRMTGRAAWGANIWYSAPQGTVWGQAPTNFGARIKFPSSPKGTIQAGGIFFYGNAGNTVMYAVEIATSAYTDAAMRYSRDEVNVYRRDASGMTQIAGRGRAVLVAENVWQDLDVTVTGNTISVFVNGKLAINVTDSSASKLTATGKLGLINRGYSVMDVEYFYSASAAGWPNPDTDNSSYLDLIKGGYYSDQNYKDGYYKTRDAKRKAGKRTITYKQQYANRYFAEFGILVHEVRPFTITFDKVPVTYSDLYFSNTYQAVALEYIGNPFAASFILANASRDNAVINGDDALTFGPDNVVNQKLMVTGRTVQQQDEKTIEVKDDTSILRRGDIPIDFTTDWIQSADAAQQLANWIVANWSTPADEISLDVFGNPLLEMTDVAGVNFPPKNMTTATHQYYITKISHAWSDGGLSTSVGLRRAR